MTTLPHVGTHGLLAQAKEEPTEAMRDETRKTKLYARAEIIRIQPTSGR